MLPRLVTLGLWVLAGVSLAAWLWPTLQADAASGAPDAHTHAGTAQTAMADAGQRTLSPADLARFFGAAAASPAGHGAGPEAANDRPRLTSSDVQLLGVLADPTDPSRGMALLAIRQAPPRVVRVGQPLGGGVEVQAIGRRHVDFSDAHGAHFALHLPDPSSGGALPGRARPPDAFATPDRARAQAGPSAPAVAAAQPQVDAAQPVAPNPAPDNASRARQRRELVDQPAGATPGAFGAPGGELPSFNARPQGEVGGRP